jgi:hypothetical protein
MQKDQPPHEHHASPSRRKFLKAAGATAAVFSGLGERGVSASAPSPDNLHGKAPLANRSPLAAQPFLPLPLGSIKPTGWLRQQLLIQANGLGGHLDETWPDVGVQSGWLGGTGESWERGPYFLDGLIPLAWLLDSEPLQAKARKFLDWTLDHPWPNGMIGPTSNNDWWPRMVMLKALTQYYELTADSRVLPVMSGYFRYQLQELPRRPLADWGRFRWQDELVSLLWLYNRTGDPQLLKLAKLLQAQGWNWRAGFEHFPFKDRVTVLDLTRMRYQAAPSSSAESTMFSHGVNNAMGIKASALSFLVSGDAADLTAVQRQLALLDEYHGLPIGIFSADEHLAGRNPSQGVELCTIVETLYSLELALAITGDPRLADRIERIAYNALPAAFTNDMWAHQYDQQPNQIECSLKLSAWATNGPDANLFGLEPHFGCCTANFHQGWPKLTASLWMASSDGGLAAMIYAPCEVSTLVNGVSVRVSEVTEYPFRDRVQIEIHPERELNFPLKLRLPMWARGATVNVNGKSATSTTRDGFIVLTRTWRSGDRLDITFDFATQAIRGFHNSVSIEHGPLVFALPITSRWVKLRQDKLTADWEVYPESAWNYAIAEPFRFQRTEQAVPSVPFSDKAPAVAITVNARRVAEWTSVPGGNYAAPPPLSPVEPSGSPQELRLIPYGAAKLRVTSFPTSKS